MAKGYREWYLKGYEEGLKEAWDDVSRMAAQGHTAQEIKIYVRSRKASVHQLLRAKENDIPRDASLVEEKRVEEKHPIQRDEKRHSGNISVKPGYSYLVKEERPDKAFSFLDDMRDGGGTCLVVTRTPPEQLRERYSLENVRVVWLTNRPSDSVSLPSGLGIPAGEVEERVSPSDLTGLSSLLVGFLKKNRGNGGILFDGVDYLSTQNQSFQQVLKFIQYINENVVDQKGNLFLAVGEGFNPEWYRMLRREMSEEIA